MGRKEYIFVFQIACSSETKDSHVRTVLSGTLTVVLQQTQGLCASSQREALGLSMASEVHTVAFNCV